MLLTGKMRLKAQLNAVLIHADGSREDLGDLGLRKSRWQRFIEFITFDQSGLVTLGGINATAADFTASGGLAVFKYHDSGTGSTAAAQTDTTLQTQAIDMISDTNFPMPYRVGAASCAKLIISQSATYYGSVLQIDQAWMVSMVNRLIAGSSEFAQIWNSAPIISGT